MAPKYPAKAHARRVAQSLQAEAGVIFLPGAPSKFYEDSDMGTGFRQRRYFFYLSGVNEADCYLTYDIAKDKLTLWIPKQRTDREILYMGPVVTKEEALKRYDIDDAIPARKLKDYLQNYLESNNDILYILHKEDTARLAIDGRIDTGSLMPAMNACRVIKDEYEIDCIRQANKITAQAHIAALRNCKVVSNESAIHGIYVGTCLALGAREQAYSPIIGAGKNAATLHYIQNNENLKGRQLLLMDAGCEWNCYACDVTRTFPLGDDFPSAEARSIYKLVEKMQDTCIAEMQPGVLFRDLQVLAHHIAVEGLLELGILWNGSVDEILEAGTSLAFFPHGLGHHVGLEVHDVEDDAHPTTTVINRPFSLALEDTDASTLVYGRFQRNIGRDPQSFRTDELTTFLKKYAHLIQEDYCHGPVNLRSRGLRDGMVVTVEPGIYFNEFGLQKLYLPSPVHSRFINQDVLKRYMPVGGVRIEDDILITADGHENLTVTPKAEEALKIIRGEISVEAETRLRSSSTWDQAVQ